METKSVKLNSSQALLIVQAMQHEVYVTMSSESDLQYKLFKCQEFIELHDVIMKTFDDIRDLHNQ